MYVYGHYFQLKCMCVGTYAEKNKIVGKCLQFKQFCPVVRKCTVVHKCVVVCTYPVVRKCPVLRKCQLHNETEKAFFFISKCGFDRRTKRYRIDYPLSNCYTSPVLCLCRAKNH